MVYVRSNETHLLESNMNFANLLILSDGSISSRNLMRAAHAKAKALASTRAELQMRFGATRTYAQDFKEALRTMWDRAHQMQRMAVAA